ncbi:MAG TPA: chromate transporter [Oscillospiraceae bacterium]|nr:chromate transporter [Oscillospiraceae bacterium]
MILLQLYLAFLKMGFFSIGGGYVMLSLIETEIITIRGWLSLPEFVDILAISEMTPGPIAINSATFIGYRIAGFWGSAVATAGVITPSIILVLLAATFLKRFYQNQWVQAAFSGLRPAVIGLIAGAAIFVTRTALVDLPSVGIALGAFILLVFTRLHPILVLALSALAGILINL